MTDPDLPKRRRARRMGDLIGLLSGSYTTHYDATCPVCKRRRHVRRFPKRWWFMPTKKNALRLAQGIVCTLPDFLIIGAAKSGTTSLYGLITAHPDVLAARTKEVKYFNSPHSYLWGEWWYRGHFPSILKKRYIAKRRGRKILSGEASSTYMFHPPASGRVRAVLPGVRLIVTLRNPIDRAYSHYNANLRGCHEHMTFEDAIASEEGRTPHELNRAASDPHFAWHRLGLHSYLNNGRYAEHLARWLDHFDRDRLLVLTLEELEADRQGAMDRVWEFLGLEPFDVGSIGAVRDSSWTRSFGAGRLLGADTGMLNVGSYPEMNPDTRRMLVDYFRPHNERLSRLLGRDFGWDR